jgi:hypothetical protein
VKYEKSFPNIVRYLQEVFLMEVKLGEVRHPGDFLIAGTLRHRHGALHLLASVVGFNDGSGRPII